MFSPEDTQWMQHAIHLANVAAAHQEVPVGAVIISNNQIIGEGWNRPIRDNDPSAHAEIVALREAGKCVNNYRLVHTTLYVTLEPCMMCVGAITQARLARVVFGAKDKRAGAVHSVFPLSEIKNLHHQAIYEGGLLEETCGTLLRTFFKTRRTFSKTQKSENDK